MAENGIKVSQIAKDLKVTSKDITERLSGFGITVKGTTVLTEEQLGLIFDIYTNLHDLGDAPIEKPAKKVVKKLKGRNAVLLDNNGALCVAGSEYDAGAIEFITNKGAKIQVCTKLYGKAKPINPVETRIMNLVYRLKYSKQAGK